MTEKLLRDLGCSEQPVVLVYNKCDTVSDISAHTLVGTDTPAVYVSAKTGAGVAELLDVLENLCG